MSTLSAKMQDLNDDRLRLAEFNRECQEEEYTDTGDAWELLERLDESITAALIAWNPLRYFHLCKGCDRPEAECSADPCAAVREDRVDGRGPV